MLDDYCKKKLYHVNNHRNIGKQLKKEDSGWNAELLII